MQNAIMHIMEQYGYLGIFLLIILENIFPPIPSEIILTFGGFMTTFTSMTQVGIIAISTAGAVLGAYILYGIGRVLSPERLEKLLEYKFVRMLGFKKDDINKSVGWFSKRGKLTVFICRCIPIVRSLISIPAGMAKMNLIEFGIFTLFGTLIWNTLLVLLGTAAGQSWEKIAGYVDKFSSITLVVLVVIFVVGAAIFLKSRLGKKDKDKNID
ncbi:alkaline phosphatase-like protein [Anaeromicropila herbilytica]|uniref:Alkaline phosphatase-like protein n=2 Tax=Anaeromicropila herbilytica TaxID=2785025 RepID=A0A7R7IF40_9FIRM|nr:DedA family protein [Anaeromicropila herbilytica]BCN31763.1 alkaline phosphatase-like protein [Anaeromicropila herbilytica]